jgi:hypothetical protein
MRYLKLFEDYDDLDLAFNKLQKGIDEFNIKVNAWDEENKKLEQEFEEKKYFIDLVESLFEDLVVDEYNYEPLDEDLDEGDRTYGLFYTFNSLTLKRSDFMSIDIYGGENFKSDFIKSKKGIIEFRERLKELGYKTEYEEEFDINYGEQVDEFEASIMVFYKE